MTEEITSIYAKLGAVVVENEQLRQQRDDLLALAEAIEWVDMSIDAYHFPDRFSNTCTFCNNARVSCCPWCYGTEREGHTDDCPRQAAIARAKGGSHD